MQILDELGSRNGLPVAAIRAADAQRAQVLPVFLEALESRAADDATQNAFFVVFHLLGQWREKSAYRALARFLRRPSKEIDSVLGDAVTETSHRVMAAVFDGDPQPLYDIILDPEVNEFLRKRMCDVLAMVTLRGELAREEAAQFLRSCYTNLQPQDECFVWDGWQGAIALLGLAEFRPLVEQAFERGFIHPSWLGLKDFEDDLRRAIEGGPPPLWQGPKEFELFGDTIEELSSWYAFANEDKRRSQDVGRPPVWQTGTAANPFKDVGRNDPCPCGSGKKFKKCCLNKSESAPVRMERSLEAQSESERFS